MTENFSAATPRCNAHPQSEPKYIPISAGTGELHCSICERLLWETNVGNIKQPDSPKKKKVTVVSKLPPNPAQDYTQPTFHKVATQIEADDPMFVPEYSYAGATGVSLVANITESGGLVRLPHRGCYVVDCGFSMGLPAGYRAEVTASATWANKGLILANADYQGRVKVAVLNAGKEIIVINHGDRFAQMTISPVYLFDWILSAGVPVGDKQQVTDDLGRIDRQ